MKDEFSIKLMAGGDAVFVREIVAPLCDEMEILFTDYDKATFNKDFGIKEYTGGPVNDLGAILYCMRFFFKIADNIADKVQDKVADKIADGLVKKAVQSYFDKANPIVQKYLEKAHESFPNQTFNPATVNAPYGTHFFYEKKQVVIKIVIIGDFEQTLRYNDMIPAVMLNAVDWVDKNGKQAFIHLYKIKSGVVNDAPIQCADYIASEAAVYG
jgi:hypothetical protein